MALQALSLSINTGFAGQPFQATVLGLTTGNVELSPDIPAGWTYDYVHGRVGFPSLPQNPQITVGLIENDPGAAVSRKESRMSIAIDYVRPLGRLTVNVPAYIAAAGSVPILGARAGSTLTLGTNPDSAWSISGGVLSWSSAAIGKPGRPDIIENYSQTLMLQRETAL